MTATIQDISAEEIRDSRGKPTLRVAVVAGGQKGSFDVPSGASTGEHEAHELRDASGGMSLALRAISESIAPALRGVPIDQQRLDETLIALDGTDAKSRLGGNALIGVSIAAARASARASGMPVYEYLRSLATIEPSRAAPSLFVNLINGGKHAEGGSPFQEHHIIPDTEDVREALDVAARVYEKLGALIRARGIEPGEGDEGGYVFPVADVETPFLMLAEASSGEKVFIGADIAASSFYRDGAYDVAGARADAADLSRTYRALRASVGLRFIEDPFHEEAFADFGALASVEPDLTLIGDDLTTTNPARIRRAAEASAIRAVIIKPNQIGTLSETLAAMQAARASGIDCIVSHRSGETMDDFVGELAYAFGVFGLKAGAPHRPERRVKYERLLELTTHA